MTTATSSTAIVLGASMGGLLAARALASSFDHVLLVERDTLDEAATLRKGVPQGAHAHGLLASGYRVIDRFFPGVMDELETQGAWRGDVLGDFLWYLHGHWKARHDSNMRGIVVSRPCLEAAIRRHVRALPNVVVRDATSAIAPAFDEARRRVSGLLVRSRHGDAAETLSCDLLVDASGRGSQAPNWLEAWGFDPPPIETIKVDVGYATRVFERRAGDFFGSSGGVIAATPPQSTRYAAVLAAEDNRWILTLAGMLGDYPPADEAGWMAYARSLPVDAVHDLAATAPAIGGISTYRFSANQRRKYEKMPRFPDGFLAIGDALCSFNPIYGQGMSTAALEAQALEATVAEGLTSLAPRFYARARRIVDNAWAIATGEDLKYPQVQGMRPPGFALVNRYVTRVHAVAAEDCFVSRRFLDVLGLDASPASLLAPAVAWRVLARRVPRTAGSPWPAMTSATLDVTLAE